MARLSWWGYAVAYGIPLLILLYVLYMNFLPFGYAETFVLDVGAEGDTDDSKVLYLKPSSALGPAEVDEAGNTFRRLNGTVEVGFNPRIVLRDATVNVSVSGTDVFVGGSIDFDPASVDWDYNWDFTSGIPADLKGNATWREDCGAYFDGTTSLYLPNSSDLFEDGPFMVYAEWTPHDSNNSFQQIVGHYNWELLQYPDKVRFMVGRMNDGNGTFYDIQYPVTDFFDSEHSALAIYSPDEENGYIELFVDDQFAGRTYISKDNLWQGYNQGLPLSSGKSNHGLAQWSVGCVHRLGYNTLTEDMTLTESSFSELFSWSSTVLLVGDGHLGTIIVHADD